MTTYTYDELAQIRRELLRQIDRMKSCRNCKYDNSMTGCGRKCKNNDNWEWDGGK